MSPKEKAKELVDKMYYSRKYKDGEDYIPQEAWVHAKQCALLAVEMIILYLPFTDLETSLGRFCEEQRNYLEQVRHEIKKYEGVQ